MPINLYVDPNEALAKGAIRFCDIPVCRYSLTIEHEKQIYTTREFIRIYHDMMMIREFETMLSDLKEKGEYYGVKYKLNAPIHLCMGEEAVAVGEAYCMEPKDILFGTHRNHGTTIAKGLAAIEKLSENELIGIMRNYLDGEILEPVASAAGSDITVKDLATDYLLYGELCEIFGKRTGFNRGLGGSTHAFFKPFGVYPNNAIAAGSVGFAVGAALYKKNRGENGFVTVNIGDGALGAGAVWEAMNMACMDQICEIWNKDGGLPLLFTIVNNHYAIHDQPMGETMGFKKAARIGAGITPDQMHAERVDGTDPMAVIDAIARKKELLEREEGPALLELVAYRLSTHTLGKKADDRAKAEIADWKDRDPIKLYREKLLRARIATEADLHTIDLSITRRLTTICKLAADMKISPRLTPEEAEALTFAGDISKAPLISDKPDVLIPQEKCSRIATISAKSRYGFDENGDPIAKSMRYNIKDAIFESIFSRFYTDSSFIAFGESQRSGNINGVFDDMAEAIPYHRFFNTPIAESAIVSSAIGYAMCGGRVAIEIMYADLLAHAGDEIINQLAKWRTMSGGTLKLPVLIRVPVGKNEGAQLSSDLSSLMAGVPGLKVIYPVTPYDMKGMLSTALNCGDPILLFENESIYDIGECFRESGVPTEEYTLPLGSADVKKEGSDITILSIGTALYRALEAATILEERYAISAEIIDARSLVPFDYETLLTSVRKTGKLVIVGDSNERGSIMRDIASNVTEFAFDELDAPPIVVGARNLIVPPYEMTKSHFPQAETILDAIHQKILPLKNYTPATKFTSTEKIRRAKEGI